MKIALLLPFVALVATADAATPAVPTDRMDQFLQEQAALKFELEAWKQSDAGQFAQEHGFVPASVLKTTQSGNGADDEHLRRLFLSKLVIEDAQAANPEATFSTDTPFTLMTEEEFTKYVGDSYRRGSSPLSVASTSEVASNFTAPLGADASKDWMDSGCVVGVKDQANCGSCWAFATVAALESAICLAGRPLTPLSEQQLVDCDQTSFGCDGGYLEDTLTFMQRNGGVCTEEGYPYESGYTGIQGNCRASSCKTEAVTIRKVVSVPQSEAGLITAINGRPVAVGIAAGNPTWKQYKSGVVSSCSSTQLDHAVLAVGYGGGSGTTPFFKIKNQWGTSWGENGFMRLKRGAGTARSGTCGIIGPDSVYPQL